MGKALLCACNKTGARCLRTRECYYLTAGFNHGLVTAGVWKRKRRK